MSKLNVALRALLVRPIRIRQSAKCRCGGLATQGVSMRLRNANNGSRGLSRMDALCTSCFDKLRMQILTELMNVED